VTQSEFEKKQKLNPSGANQQHESHGAAARAIRPAALCCRGVGCAAPHHLRRAARPARMPAWKLLAGRREVRSMASLQAVASTHTSTHNHTHTHAHMRARAQTHTHTHKRYVNMTRPSARPPARSPTGVCRAGGVAHSALCTVHCYWACVPAPRGSALCNAGESQSPVRAREGASRAHERTRRGSGRE